MNRTTFKYMAVVGVAATFCACGGDSSTTSEPVNTPAQVSNPCSPYVVFHAGRILALNEDEYWVLDEESLQTTGVGLLYDKEGKALEGYTYTLEDNLLSVYDPEGLFVSAAIQTLLRCDVNASIDPYTGEIIKSSESTPVESSGATNPGSSASVNPNSSGTVLGSSATNPGSSGAVDPNSSAAVVGSSGSVVPGSSAVEPESSSNPELGPDGFPTIESYGDPPAEYTKDILNNGKTGWSSRYWDACKPHCSWLSSVDTTSEAAYQAGRTVARNCNIHDVEVPAFTLGHAVQQYWMGYEGTNSACVNSNAGGTYTCTDMAPIQVTENLSYGYVAAPGAQFGGGCGKCFHLQFNGGNHANDVKETHKALKGKHMIVMASNIGYDVEAPASGLGANGGGFLTECQQSLGWDNTVEAYQQCVIKKCDEVFKDWPNLLRGCKWYAEWFMAADNPTYNWEEVECPQYLIDHYLTTFNTTLENRWRWHDDWSDYKKGDVLDTVYCWKDGENPNDPNGKGAGCAP